MNLYGIGFEHSLGARDIPRLPETKARRRARSMALSGLGGHLAQYDEVRVLQELLNLEATACGYPGPIEVTGEYDATTHQKFLAYLTCMVRTGLCHERVIQKVDRYGPYSAHFCLIFSEEEQTILQQAWEEWRRMEAEVEVAARSGDPAARPVLRPKVRVRGKKGGAWMGLIMIGGAALATAIAAEQAKGG